jgi:hypothetical protein
MTIAERKDCAHVCTTEVPPANWVGNLSNQGRCTDVTAKHTHSAILSDFYGWATNPSESAAHSASRHETDDARHFSVRISQMLQGRRWVTTTQAVMDDFGWLVEVPTC